MRHLKAARSFQERINSLGAGFKFKLELALDWVSAQPRTVRAAATASSAKGPTKRREAEAEAEAEAHERSSAGWIERKGREGQQLTWRFVGARRTGRSAKGAT